MVLTAVRGGLGFLSRLPVGTDERAWEAFRRTPVAFVIVGYVLGVVLALPLFLPLPDVTLALVFVSWLYLVTGITHLDGLADLGDAFVVHGDRRTRREVMRDTTLGVGGLLAVVLAVTGLVLAALLLAELPRRVVLVVVAAEVSAKLGMGALACLGTAAHDGFGSAVSNELSARNLFVPALVATPVALLAWPRPATAIAFGAGLFGSVVVGWLATRRLGGISGDVLGASNEVARLFALHAGVIAWTAS